MKQAYKEATKGPWIDGKLDTQYAFEETDDTLIVRFQGSSSALDWWHNIDFSVKPYRKMNSLFFVHRGVLAKYKAVRKEILSAVGNNIDKHIEVRGFSQGAALALLAHEDIVFNFDVQPDTIVFGCPRVFSFWNFKLLNKRLNKITRVENGGDIVTGLPPKILGFKHYGKKIHIGKKKLFKLSIKDHTTYKDNL